jgi:hypothetical protein
MFCTEWIACCITSREVLLCRLRERELDREEPCHRKMWAKNGHSSIFVISLLVPNTTPVLKLLDLEVCSDIRFMSYSLFHLSRSRTQKRHYKNGARHGGRYVFRGVRFWSIARHEGHYFLYRTEKSSSFSAGKLSAPVILIGSWDWRQWGTDDDTNFPWWLCGWVCKMFVF